VMMRALWIQLAGACRLAASLRSRRFLGRGGG